MSDAISQMYKDTEMFHNRAGEGEGDFLKKVFDAGIAEQKMEEDLSEKMAKMFRNGSTPTSEQGKKFLFPTDMGTEVDNMEKVGKALRYNQGKLKWHLVDFQALEPMVKVLMYGADKYAPGNWKKGFKLSDITDSMMRHQVALANGEKVDAESGLPHVGHILCNALFLSWYLEVHPDKILPEE